MTVPPRGGAGVVMVAAQLLFAQVLELALSRHGYAVDTLDLSQDTDPHRLMLRSLQRHPDVLLVDLDLGSLGDGAALIPPAVHAGVAVVVMTASASQSDLTRAIESGAQCVLATTSPLAELLYTVERLLQERASVPAQV